MKKSSRQPLERAVLYPMVVSDSVGEATLVASPDPAESGSLFADGLRRPTRRVSTTTLTNGGSEKLPGASTL